MTPLKLDSSDKPLGEHTAWELLCKLRADGWVWKRAPASVEARASLRPITKDSFKDQPEFEFDNHVTHGQRVKPGKRRSTKPRKPSKVFYILGVTSVKVAYMRCLLDHQRLFDAGIVMIRHLMAPSYYVSMFELKIDGSQAIVSKRQRRQRAKNDASGAGNRAGGHFDEEATRPRLEADHGVCTDLADDGHLHDRRVKRPQPGSQQAGVHWSHVGVSNVIQSA